MLKHLCAALHMASHHMIDQWQNMKVFTDEKNE